MTNLRSSSCAQREDEYLESELRDRKIWNSKSVDHWKEKQFSRDVIPGWLNAPAWAVWLQFCQMRGWVFVSEEQPHVYSDGVMTSDVQSYIGAGEVPGVLFYSNRGYTASGAPHWVCDRRAGNLPK